MRKWLDNELRATLRSPVDPRLAGVLALLVVVLLIGTQIPLSYTIAIGQEDGPGADLPLVERFYGAEQNQAGRFRWSGARSYIQLPGFGARSMPLTLQIRPLTPDILARGPQTLELWADGRQIAPLRLQLEGARYHVLLPDSLGERQVIELRSTTFRQPGDPRELGAPVGVLQIRRMGLAWPDGHMVAGWALLAILLWTVLRRSGSGPTAATGICSAAVILIGLTATLDPPRSTLAIAPLTLALALAWILMLPLRTALPWLAGRWAVPLPIYALNWLLLMGLLTFVLRYGGKLYPEAMPGDIGFHTNRFVELIEGRLLLQAPHRGVLSPYAPGPYLILAPLTLAGIQPSAALRLMAALFDTLSPALVYLITVAGYNRCPGAARAGLVAAGFYTLAPGGLLAHWWNFSTHIVTQFAHLALIATAMLAWTALADPTRRTGRWIAGLILAQCLVYLGHFGYWINASLLMGGMVGLTLGASLIGRITLGAALRTVVAGTLAQIVTIVLFYSAYLGLLGTQAATVGAGAEQTVTRSLQSLIAFTSSILGEGLRDHTGLFPVALALSGIGLGLSAPSLRRHIAPAGAALAVGTLIISAGFGLLPLLSGANLSPRWLMFALWAIGATGAPAAIRLWRSGRAARLLLLLITAYLAWVSASIWLAALAWRVRPPEPF